MAFTSKLGTADSKLANVELGEGAIEYPVGNGSITISGPALSGSATFTAPRYPLVQQTTVTTTSNVFTFSSLPTAGNLIVVKIAGDATVVTDNQGVGNTYFQAATANRAGFISEIWYAYNIGATSGTFTITATGATGGQAAEYSGFGSLDPLYTVGSFSGSGATTLSGTTPTVNPNAIGVAATNVANVFGLGLVSGLPWKTDYNFGGFGIGGFHEAIKTAGTQSISFSTASGYSAVLAIFQDPNDFTAPRATQSVQSLLTQQVAALRATQQVQSLVTQTTSALRATQVVLTLIALNGTAPTTLEVSLLAPRLRWGLERFDIKTRDEEVS